MDDTPWMCTSCKKPKAELKKRKSKALPGAEMYLCQECIDNKREPRAFVVLAGRKCVQSGDVGLEAIQYWIKPQRHLGEPIQIRELV